MAAPTYAWSNITASMVDSDSPLNETLMTYIRQNLIHLEEWLGASYTAAQDHDHDGVNSKKVTGVGTDAVDQGAIANNAVGQGELKSTNGQVGPGAGNFTLPGGQYGFYPQIYTTGPVPTTDVQIAKTKNTNSTWITNVYISTGASYARQQYIQASPPYVLGMKQWGHFLFLLTRISNGKIVCGYEAEDPPWAYNGPAKKSQGQPGKDSRGSTSIRRLSPKKFR